MTNPFSPHADFMRLARNLQAGNIDFDANNGDSGEDDGLDVQKLITEAPLREANSVSSRIIANTRYESVPGDSLKFQRYDLTTFHKVVIDLDMDAALIPSSTPGHHHLIIDTALSWRTYSKLLDALLDAGLIQPGYHRASWEREATWIRTPWTRKAGAGHADRRLVQPPLLVLGHP